MTISELIKPGDKVDLQLVQQIESAEKTGTKATVYKSQVLDRRKNGNFIISMPIEAGRLILLPIGVRYELTFYCGGSMYRCIGQIVERYKKDNLYMLEVELKTQLERYQRREFYRYNCTIDVDFYVLNEEHKTIESTEIIMQDLLDMDFTEERCKGVIVDLSGGGMKFRSEVQLKAGDQILVLLRLINARMDKQYQILGEVIECTEIRVEKMRAYESRVQFSIKDNKIREEIIRYIFEEERKIRKKENG